MTSSLESDTLPVKSLQQMVLKRHLFAQLFVYHWSSNCRRQTVVPAFILKEHWYWLQIYHKTFIVNLQ